jgi:hypothetical protein
MEAAVGDIVVRVPTNLTVTVDAQTNMGGLDLPGTWTYGGIGGSRSIPTRTGPGKGSLSLRLRDGIGTIHVIPVDS